MISTERLKSLLAIGEKWAVHRRHDGPPPTRDEMNILPEELIDMCSDALSWRKHCGPPLHCEGKPHD